MKLRKRLLPVTVSAAALLLLVSASAARSPAKLDRRLAKINHWIVVYQENWSFDGLYGTFPNADGLKNAAATIPQVDRLGHHISLVPDFSLEPNVPAGLPIKPFDLAQYIDLTAETSDLKHAFYTEQLQIDNGNVEPSNGVMDKFVAWTDNPSLVMSYYDTHLLAEGKLAAQYLLCDHFFHGAFGGSFLNHQHFVAAQPPHWNQPLPARAGFKSSCISKPDSKALTDGNLTFDGQFVINTTFSAVAPRRPVPADELMRAINNVDPSRPDYTPTICNRMDEAGIAWHWYSGGWTEAVAGKPARNFQFHHQPLAYYAKYAPFLADGKTPNPHTTGPDAPIQDESQFFIDLAQGKLPAVSIVKPIGELNEHPGYTTLLPGQQHVAEIVHAVQNSPLWVDTAIIVTYDDHGGRWDHVPPPKRDRWGPGSRVPTIIISPLTWRGGVQHASYDTLSILKTLEDRYDMPPLNASDAGATNMADCFQPIAHTAIDLAYTQPDADRPSHSVLIVGGTPRADQIHISRDQEWTVVRIRSAGNVTVRISKFRTKRLSRIEVYGQGGDDNIQIESEVALPALVLCGGGNNFVRTGGGASIVVGGGGNNRIEGGSGQNVLIGGATSARLKAGPRGDVLLAGTTDYDANIAALRDILRQWAAPNVKYADRVARLRGEVGGSDNAALLKPANVRHSRGASTLVGGPNTDWFLANTAQPGGDSFIGKSADSIVTPL